MILLDTNAVIWLSLEHRRARPLRTLARLHISPASLLELQFLVETGRLRFKDAASVETIASDTRWQLDEPPGGRWFTAACELGWTRDPFDRLIAAHARLRRWKLATGDEQLIEQLPPSSILAL